MKRLGFLSFLLQQSATKLTRAQVDAVWDGAYTNALSPQEREFCLTWLQGGADASAAAGGASSAGGAGSSSSSSGSSSSAGNSNSFESSSSRRASAIAAAVRLLSLSSAMPPAAAPVPVPVPVTVVVEEDGATAAVSTASSNAPAVVDTAVDEAAAARNADAEAAAAAATAAAASVFTMFDCDIAEYLYRDRMTKSLHAEDITLAGFRCLERYFLLLNAQRGLIELGDSLTSSSSASQSSSQAVWQSILGSDISPVVAASSSSSTAGGSAGGASGSSSSANAAGGATTDEASTAAALAAAAAVTPVFSVLDFDSLTGFDVIWRVAFEAQDDYVVTAAIRFLIAVHENLAPSIATSARQRSVRTAFIDACMARFQASRTERNFPLLQRSFLRSE
jgi:hypothetical protein